MLNSNNVVRYEFLKVARSISSLLYKTEEIQNLENNINEKVTEILTESDENIRMKEVLTILQLILCQSEHLPAMIIQELFNSLLLIINSVTLLVKTCEGNQAELKESVKTICLAILNWEFKQGEDHYESIKKHQEEYILLKSQEIIIQCLRSGLLKHDIGHIIFEYFFTQATKEEFKLQSDKHESVFSSGETVIGEIMRNNLYIVVDTLLAEKEENFSMIQDINKKTEKLINNAQAESKYYQDQFEIYLRVYQLILYKIDFYSQSEEETQKRGEKIANYFHRISESLF